MIYTNEESRPYINVNHPNIKIIIKPLNEFYKNRTQPDGYGGLCKKCKQQYNKDKG